MYDPINCSPPASSSMEYFKQEYSWSGLPFPTPGYFPYPGIEPASPALAGGFFITHSLGKPFIVFIVLKHIVERIHPLLEHHWTSSKHVINSFLDLNYSHYSSYWKLSSFHSPQIKESIRQRFISSKEQVILNWPYTFDLFLLCCVWLCTG